MVDHGTVPPGTGRRLLRAAERRVAGPGRIQPRLDCLASNPRLTSYCLDTGYRVFGHKADKPQQGGTTVNFAFLEKSVRYGARDIRQPVGRTAQTRPTCE